MIQPVTTAPPPHEGEPIRVLVVDDSAFMRKMVTQILQADPGIEVVGQARDGLDALQKLDTLCPDVVTLDIEMPAMDGLTALGEIRRRRPTARVVMLSSLTQAGAETTLRCLEMGAVDFVGKPSGSISLDIERVAAELVGKVKIAAAAAGGARLAPLPARPAVSAVGAPRPAPALRAAPLAPAGAGHAAAATAGGIRRGASPYNVVLAIGASTGGPRALASLIPALPAELQVPVVIVQHMPAGFTASFAKRLDDESAYRVREAADGDALEPGVALLAPGGRHLSFDARGIARLSDEPPVHGVRPAVDVTFASLIPLCRERLVAVLLTGIGKDGARSLKALRDLGAHTLAEDESTCVVYGMPRAAFEAGGVCRLLPLPRLGPAAVEAVRAAQNAAAPRPAAGAPAFTHHPTQPLTQQA